MASATSDTYEADLPPSMCGVEGRRRLRYLMPKNVNAKYIAILHQRAKELEVERDRLRECVARHEEPSHGDQPVEQAGGDGQDATVRQASPIVREAVQNCVSGTEK